MIEPGQPCVRISAGVRPGRPHVQEVDVLPVDRGGELRIGVEPVLEAAPVVLVSPVFDQPAYLRGRYAVVPAGAGQVLGEAGTIQPIAYRVELSLRYLDPKRPILHGRRKCAEGAASDRCHRRPPTIGATWRRTRKATTARSSPTPRSRPLNVPALVSVPSCRPDPPPGRTAGRRTRARPAWQRGSGAGVERVA
jgi:hypothetical protein